MWDPTATAEARSEGFVTGSKEKVERVNEIREELHAVVENTAA
jgi:hypothetical protein